MDEERILELLAKRIAKEASVQELEELEIFMGKYPDLIYHLEVLNQLKHTSEEDENAEQLFHAHRHKYKGEFFPGQAITRKAAWPNTLKGTILFCSALFIAFLSWFVLSDRKSDFDNITTKIIAEKGTRKKIKLPDGSMVWLNSESSLSFDPSMQTKANRQVKLLGEAFFDVAKDKNHPFIIETENITIKVLGTTFNVRDYANEGSTEASLLDGMIELNLNEQPQQKIILKPNQKFALKATSPSNSTGKIKSELIKKRIIIDPIIRVKVADKEYLKETSWIANELVFSNESMEELVPQLERWYNIHIDIEKSVVKKYRFTGVFKDENITQALTAMSLIKPFNFKIDENEVKIY